MTQDQAIWTSNLSAKCRKLYIQSIWQTTSYHQWERDEINLDVNSGVWSFFQLQPLRLIFRQQITNLLLRTSITQILLQTQAQLKTAHNLYFQFLNLKVTKRDHYHTKHIQHWIRSDQIRSDIGLLRVDKRNSTIHSRNDIRNNVNE